MRKRMRTTAVAAVAVALSAALAAPAVAAAPGADRTGAPVTTRRPHGLCGPWSRAGCPV